MTADALKNEGIYMNSVDTGWINDGEHKHEHAFSAFDPQSPGSLAGF